MLSEIHDKTDQHCQAEDCLAINMDRINRFATEFINKVILSFQKRLRSCVACCRLWRFWTQFI